MEERCRAGIIEGDVEYAKPVSMRMIALNIEIIQDRRG